MQLNIKLPEIADQSTFLSKNQFTFSHNVQMIVRSIFWTVPLLKSHIYVLGKQMMGRGA